MHLSMLSPRVGWGRATHGKLTRRGFPWVGILTFGFYPGVGNLTFSRYPGVGNLTLALVKMSNSPGSACPPPPGGIDRCISPMKECVQSVQCFALLKQWWERHERDSSSDLYDAGAVLYQLSYLANWELIIMRVHDKTISDGYRSLLKSS